MGVMETSIFPLPGWPHVFGASHAEQCNLSVQWSPVHWCLHKLSCRFPFVFLCVPVHACVGTCMCRSEDTCGCHSFFFCLTQHHISLKPCQVGWLDELAIELSGSTCLHLLPFLSCQLALWACTTMVPSEPPCQLQIVMNCSVNQFLKTTGQHNAFPLGEADSDLASV